MAPGLRIGTPSNRCSGCAHFGFASGHSWNGECYLYDVPVREDFVCDSVRDIDDLPSGPPEPNRKRVPRKTNSGPRMESPYNPFESIDVSAGKHPGAAASIADILKDLEANKSVT